MSNVKKTWINRHTYFLLSEGGVIEKRATCSRFTNDVIKEFYFNNNQFVRQNTALGYRPLT